MGPDAERRSVRELLAAAKPDDREATLWLGLVLLAGGLLASPLPWLALVAPAVVLIWVALRAVPRGDAE